MSRGRDEFPKRVVRTLADRVCHRCSCPNCRKSTLGPHDTDSNKSINLGKAAHITAAASGGPRYDSSLTPEQRRSIQNGIWLCTLHADLVDKDEASYPVSLLREWKEHAEKIAATEAFTGQGDRSPRVVFELSEEDRDYLRTLALPSEDTTEAILQRLIEAARDDIQAFLSRNNAPAHAIPLGLTFVNASEGMSTSLSGLANGLSVTSAIALVSPPGTGKTTTLIQLAETILEGGDKVAAYLPLAEWEGTRDPWFETLRHRNAFRAFKPQHFMQLAYEGRLVLLLDGWNELSPQASTHAHRELNRLQREFPQLGVVLGTRQQAHGIDGPFVRIEPLHEEQQLDLSHRLRGSDGERLIDQAWRTPGLRELVTIPLYLKALLLGVQGDAFPDTKDAILDSFVQQHESAPEKAVPLRDQLQGVHREILAVLAGTANTSGTTALTEEQARNSVAVAVGQLQARNQLTVPLQPATVLDALVNSHLLVRTSAGGNIAFQHQQFQEWYASFYVEQLILDATQGDADAGQALRESVLDRIAWEESILFACERLSHRDHNGAAAVARTITDTLGIDPLLAASMIQRSASDVWLSVREQVMNVIRRWHTPGHADRALKFMLITGKADFAREVWPFLEHQDSQVSLHALRLADPFQPSVLGTEAAERLSALPDAQRGEVLAEIADQSGYDGMDLVTDIASKDSNAQVVVNVLEALESRGAMHHVTSILSHANDAVWEELAKRRNVRDLPDPDQQARLTEMHRLEIENEEDPIRQAHLVLYSHDSEINVEERLSHILTTDALSAPPEEWQSLIHAIDRRYPAVAIAALIACLEAGHDVPYGVEDILDKAEAVDSGPIADAALTPGNSRNAAKAVHRLIGPITVGKLIDTFVTLHTNLIRKPYNQAASDQYHALRGAISNSRQASFVPALIERSNANDIPTIVALSDLLHLHGKDIDHPPMTLSAAERAKLQEILLRWSTTLLNAPDATRHDIIRVVQAMQRVPTPEFVPILDTMLQRDIAETAKERDELRSSRRGGALMSWNRQYRATFAAIGSENVIALMEKYLTDLQFGVEAARVLLDLWNRDHPSETNRRWHGWNDYSGVIAHHAQMGKEPSVSSDFAEAIWNVVRQYGQAEEPAETQQHAVELANIAMRMPFATNRPEIQALFNLPLPYAAKQNLIVTSAMSGVVLQAEMLTAAVQELLNDARTQSWRLDEGRGELMTWIELFAFSDQPIAVLDVLDLLPPNHRGPYQLRRLLDALGHSPHPDAPMVLNTLAERDPRITEDDAWSDALIRLNSIDAACTLLDALCTGSPSNPQRHTSDRFVDRLVEFAKRHPEFRDEILARYTRSDGYRSHDMLESLLLTLADQDAVLAVVHDMTSRGAEFDHRLSWALYKLAIGQAPSKHWINAMELFSVPLTSFRKQLFALITDDRHAGFAQKSLETIDELRDKYGHIHDEPRHPDITSGKPWPIVPQTSESA